jgi:hypothetical protein
MHSIWAVARNTLAQALRMKIAAVVILLLLILLPLMSMVMDGDGTLLGKLQTFTSYGLGLISLLLCILTIAISTYTLSNDLKCKYIFLVVTKPIRRFELILGKLLGVILLDILLLGIFSAILYSCTRLIPKITDAPESQKFQANAEFFTSRIGIKTELDKDLISNRVRQRYEELKSSDQIPEDMLYARIMSELYGQEAMKAQRVDPGQTKEWDFEDVHVKNADDPNTFIFVRYKYQTASPPPDEKVYGLWRVGDLRQFKAGAAKIKTPFYDVQRDEVIRVTHEFAVPANAIAEDGYVAIGFFNSPALNQTAIIPEELELLYQTGNFTMNYFRAVLMILVRLVFLAVIGISLTTWLSFPVAVLVCITIFFVGLTNGFILDAIGGMGSTAGMMYSILLKPLLWLLPQFDGVYNPNGYIVSGRTIQWAFLATTAMFTLLVKAGLMLLAGIGIFHRREVARVAA